jgi:hypothetical protein
MEAQWNLESSWSKTLGIHNVRISLSLCILTLKAFNLYQAARSGPKLTTKTTDSVLSDEN